MQYCRLIRESNLRINLVSRRDVGNLVTGHILDSLVAAPLVQDVLSELGTRNPELETLDIGSGAGLPGIPLKICFPNAILACLEATQKKARFIEGAVRELKLTGVTVIPAHSRTTEHDPRHRGRYDLVVVRAVAQLGELVRLSFPFLRVGGRLLAYKASNIDGEIASAQPILKKLNAVIVKQHRMALPLTDKHRVVVVVQKTGA